MLKLFEGLTGRRFYLARSGYQAGSDASSDTLGQAGIKVEAKRYGDSTTLNDREILGELEEAYQAGGLDLWAFVTTRAIPAQLREKLAKAADGRHIELLLLGRPVGQELDDVALLCASSPDLVLSHLAQAKQTCNREVLKRELSQARRSPGFAAREEELRKRLESPRVGFASWKEAMHRELRRRLHDPQASRAKYGQALDLGRREFVPRHSVIDTLESWKKAWQTPMVVLGEEGVGKTWATLAWADEAATSWGPAFVLVTANHMVSQDPVALVAEATAALLQDSPAEGWTGRISRWLKPSGPVMVLILDGLNESPACGNWDGLLQALFGFREKIAVLATCRESCWERQYPYFHPHWRRCAAEPFDDGELGQALQAVGASKRDIPAGLVEYLRRPRYFDLAWRLRDNVKEGEITLARLLFEDWRDRLGRRLGLGRIGFSPAAFEEFIKGYARKRLQRESFDRLAGLLPEFVDRQAVLRELVDEGILTGTGREVREDHLAQGLGLVLAEEVRAASDAQAARETLSRWLEPCPDMDLKGAACGAACLSAMEDEGYPEHSLAELLKTWFGTHNYDLGPPRDNVAAYLPLVPHVYADVAEYFWSARDDPRAQRLLVAGVTQMKASDRLEKGLRFIVRRWMALVHPLGSPTLRHLAAEERRRGVADRLGSTLAPGEVEVAGCRIRVLAEDQAGLLRLTRLAWAFLERVARPGELADSIAAWAVSRSINGRCDEWDVARWVLRRQYEDLWPALRTWIERLLQTDSGIAREAADWLLRLCGSTDARTLRAASNLADAPGGRRIFLDPWARAAEKSPDPISRLSEQDLITVVEAGKKLDLGAVAMGPAATAEDRRLEEILTILARHSPHDGVRLVQRLAAELPGREAQALFLLLLKLQGHLVALNDADREIFLQVRDNLLALDESQGTADLWSEFHVCRALLYGQPPDEQWRVFSARPPWAVVEFDGLDLLSPADPETLQRVFEQVAPELPEFRRLRAEAWLAANPFLCPEGGVQRILSLVSDPSARVRIWALRAILACRDESSRQAFVESSWRRSEKTEDFEMTSAGAILAQAARNRPWEEVLAIVPLPHLGPTVVARGSLQEEVVDFADRLDTLWENLRSNDKCADADSVPDAVACTREPGSKWPVRPHLRPGDSLTSQTITFVDHSQHWGGRIGDVEAVRKFKSALEGGLEDFEADLNECLQEQDKIGNIWFSGWWSDQGMAEVAARCPDLAEKWLRAAEDDTRLLGRFPRLYESLCSALLRVAPDLGCGLHASLLDSGAILVVDLRTNLPRVTHALLRVPGTPEIQAARRQLFDACKSDLDLLHLAVATQLEGSSDWLDSEVDRLLESRRHVEVARGVALSCFRVLEEPTGPRLPAGFEGSWVNDHASDLADQLSAREVWGRKWYRQFLEAEDKALSWGGFRLFLSCADSRFFVWGPLVVGGREKELGGRLDFLNLNHEELSRRIRDNEKKLGKALLGMPVLMDPVPPWWPG